MDRVCSYSVLGKIWDPFALVLESYRALQPDGPLIWSEFELSLRDVLVASHKLAERSPKIVRACSRDLRGAFITVNQELSKVCIPVAGHVLQCSNPTL